MTTTSPQIFLLEQHKDNTNHFYELIRSLNVTVILYNSMKSMLENYEKKNPSLIVYLAPKINISMEDPLADENPDALLLEKSKIKVPIIVLCQKEQKTENLFDGRYSSEVDFLFPPISHNLLLTRIKKHLERNYIESKSELASLRFHEMEREKEDLQEKIRKAQNLAMIGELASGVIHDVNNVLSVILGTAEIANYRYGKLNSSLEKYISTIISVTKRAGISNKRMLALAKGSKNKLVNYSIHDLVDEVVELLEHTIPKKYQIIKELNAKNYNMVGDPALFQNIIINIAFNARDAMINGGKIIFSTKNITMSSADVANLNSQMKGGEYILVSIQDTGIGMDEKTKSKIFEPFFTTKGQDKGTGLGLSNVIKNTLDHHGGIEVETELGLGTTFKLYFKIVKESDSSKEKDLKPRLPKGRGNLLIVDDEVELREIFKEMLSDVGYNVITVEDGMEAISYFKDHYKEIDLVVVDMNLPKITGKECFHHLKRLEPDVKVILSTGHSFNDDAEELLGEGVSGFIQKPFEMGHLLEVIDKVIH